MKESKSIRTGKNTLLPYTRKIKLTNNKQTELTFFPILLQEYIKPFCEIRVFVIKDKVFSMAIFCELKKQGTNTDWRHSNTLGINRYVPFKLPHNIKVMVLKLMNKMKLNTGSIDLILTERNEYYFLEINPTGQFHFLSSLCNYNIEKEIAEILFNESSIKSVN
jgi:glutathione synthase/RimK-type ligase-like ATP-grasp enzyme